MGKRRRDEEAGEDRGRSAAEPSPSSSSSANKRPKHAFRVAPENLPDGPWKRKLLKDKKEQLRQSKLERQHAKLKARAQREAQEAAASKAAAVQQGPTTHLHLPPRQQPGASVPDAESDPVTAGSGIHPERQEMLANDDAAAAHQEKEQRGRPRGGDPQQQQRKPGQKRPDYFQRDLALAEKRRAEAAARADEARLRAEERARKVAERERVRRAMAEATRPTRGPNGERRPRRLGKESAILLDKVRKLMGADGGNGR